MQRVIFLLAGLYGATGVACGAFGAHALKGRLSVPLFAAFQTAVLYQLLHAVALLALAHSATKPSTPLFVAQVAFALGILLFSGSLYGLATFGWRALGPVTPVGGLCLMIGWIAVGWESCRR